jgi:hypothetical protein
MPNFDAGFYYIDLEHTNGLKEYMINKDQLVEEKDRKKELQDLEEKKDRMPLVQSVFDFDYAVRPCISPDGRTLALPSAYNAYFIDPSSM